MRLSVNICDLPSVDPTVRVCFSLAIDVGIIKPYMCLTSEVLSLAIVYLMTLTYFIELFDFVILDDGWMDGCLAILRPFQQYFSHIRTMRGG